MMSDLETRALDMAHEAHKGQKRKYTGEDYINHPIEVCDLIKHGGWDTPENRAAALLHDVVEDTDVRHQDIFDMFGEEVFQRVFYLTDVSRHEDGGRVLRKKIDRIHLISSRNPHVYMIKCCDLISNMGSIKEHDPGFAKIYCQEKKLMLDEMIKIMPILENHKLYTRACELT